MLSLDHKVPPPVIAIVVATGMWGLSALGPHILLVSPFRQIIIALLVAIGLTLDVLGILSFRRARTTVNPLRPRQVSSMVTDGVYRYTRNPMYLGMATLLLAWAVHLSALPSFLGVVIFVLYITRFQIQPEERALQAVFGDEYLAYTSRVRRWL